MSQLLHYLTAKGELLKQLLTAASNGKIEESIDLSHLPKGAYLLKIEGIDEIRIEKIIVL